ncbi:cysteine peptidase family C39 domain-containing protein [Niveibacterium sp. SC-1]|uniref:cysteine peptidase family C39 domain-containing protein n=1 Tax=Niveibacterium sp. SC-1 TaxID=3135646 RepID=UPI0031204836
MRRVIQEDSTGCGLACVAMLAGRSYQAVKKQAHSVLKTWPRGPRSFYTTKSHLKALLAEYGVRHGNYRKADSWEKLNADLAIVAINLQANDNWHWVVFRRDGSDRYLLDPRAKSERRIDFWRARIMAYLPIRTNDVAKLKTRISK